MLFASVCVLIGEIHLPILTLESNVGEFVSIVSRLISGISTAIGRGLGFAFEGLRSSLMKSVNLTNFTSFEFVFR